jgi:hypothetical protein
MLNVILMKSPISIVYQIMYVFNLTAGNMANIMAYQRTILELKTSRDLEITYSFE